MTDLEAQVAEALPCNYIGRCNSSRCPCRLRPAVLALIREAAQSAPALPPDVKAAVEELKAEYDPSDEFGGLAVHEAIDRTAAVFQSRLAAPPLPSDPKLAEIAARCAKATPGPWHDIASADAARPDPLQWQHQHEIRELDRSPSDKHSWPYRICQTIAGQSCAQAGPDFDFIAHAREDIPLLLSRLAELESENARLHYNAQEAWDTAHNNCAERDDALAREAKLREALTFQARVQPWMLECFGEEISNDIVERCDRLLEEVFEALQSQTYDPRRIAALRDYVWGRPVGEPAQEVGGVMVTLAAFCFAANIDMHAAGETELARIWTKVEQIRAKQAAKPKHSPLPAPPAQGEG